MHCHESMLKEYPDLQHICEKCALKDEKLGGFSRDIANFQAARQKGSHVILVKFYEVNHALPLVKIFSFVN